MIWKAEKNGCYSVRSAYRTCIEDIINNEHLRKPRYWSGIWRLKVPPKVKNLVWRICRDCFPTRVKLRSRGVNCPSGCVRCEDPHEDSYHILFHCPSAVVTWQTANLWHLISPSLNQFDNAPDNIFNLLQKLSAAQIEISVTIMWSIWKARNLKLWQQVTDSNFTILERARHLLEGWRNASRKQVHLNPTTSDSGSSSASQYQCQSQMEKIMCYTPSCSVDLGEALALNHAIQWIHELQLSNVDFEVDSKRVADYFNKGRGDVTEFGSIMDNSLNFCNDYLTNSHVEFIRRQENEVAHTF
ncbi:uncharacterized protein [Medicago truncatula]|uniref:uncharacterized protein n=1 Tax=Medicago truncatula TaxID=3880 RepID=UPI001967229E|nr:uncharacterized protein LOC120579487 [Medicago truncatula]